MKKRLLALIPVCLCIAVLAVIVVPQFVHEYGMSETERAVRDKISVTMMSREVPVSQISKQEAVKLFGEGKIPPQEKGCYYFKDTEGGIYTYTAENKLKSYFSGQGTFPEGKDIVISEENALQEMTPVLKEVVPNLDEFELFEQEVGDTIGVLVFEREIAEGIVDQVSITFWTTGDIHAIVCNYSGFLSPDEITKEQRAELDRQAEAYIPVVEQTVWYEDREVEVEISGCMLSRQNGYIKGEYSYLITYVVAPTPGVNISRELRTFHHMESQEFFVKE